MRIKTLLIAAMSLIATAVSAQTTPETAYAVICEASDTQPSTLYFLAAVTAPTGTYNKQEISQNNGKECVWSGEEVTKSSLTDGPGWASVKQTASIERVVFESSFDNVRPESCAYWFCNFQNLSSIKSMLYLNTTDVTSMRSMFSGCSALKNFIFSSGFNTENVTDMSHMFDGCTALTEISCHISLNTDNLTDMSYMLNGCNVLTNIDFISHFNTANVTNMSHLFDGCSALTDFPLSSGFNTANVTDMSYMFKGCTGMTRSSFYFETENLTNMSHMFDGCTGMTEFTSHLNTANVTDMSYMFNGCSALNDIHLTDFNTANVTDMSYMLNGCSAVKILYMSNFNTGNVTDMSYMFCGCSALESLTLDRNFATRKVTDMTFMFGGCSALKALDLSSFSSNENLTYNDMFNGCDALLSLDLRNAGKGGLMAATNSGFAKRGMVFYLSDVASTSDAAFDENYVVKLGSWGETWFTRTFTGGKISTVCLPFAVYADNNDGTFY